MTPSARAQNDPRVVLVLDIGTSGLRAALVDAQGEIVDFEYVAQPPTTPAPGLVEFDPIALFDAAVRSATIVMNRNAWCVPTALGITNQRASVVAWDARTSLPVGPGIGWQDLRTVFDCITAKTDHGVTIAPNQTATKAAWLIANLATDTPPSALRLGTIDAWLTWKLSAGRAFATDHSNAAVTGLVDVKTVDWDPHLCNLFGIPIECLPEIVASRNVVGSVLDIGPLEGIPLAARIGDQQSSLVGQGCIAPGLMKITFGTGGMLNMYTGLIGPTEARRTPHGTFPIVAFSLDDERRSIHWGIEAIMLSAGTNLEWLCDDMGILASPADSDVAAMRAENNGGVTFIPALLGLGTPDWDYGARGTLIGLTRGTNRDNIVRAVLDGIAQRGADLVDAARADADARGVAEAPGIRTDGGMTRNASFLRLLADATGRTIEVSPHTESTTLGAAFLAGSAASLPASRLVWDSLNEATATWRARTIVTPSLGPKDRAEMRRQWSVALAAARGWIPDLSALDF